ncbi:hypothetical protein SDC9_197411 [bioreactor metagenome]|uniref:Uncharacterized protein n=1 Tax=bioreactor metagenome TaxID=1076179 RepID=A0A645IH41_9ZZZZ
MAYQAVDCDYPAFYIGLDWIQPDTLGEGDVAYISEFAGVIFLDSINSSFCYRFLSTGNEVMGLDAPPACNADIKGDVVKAVFATCQVSDCGWDPQNNRLLLRLLHNHDRRECHIGFALDEGSADPKSIFVAYGDKQEDVLNFYNRHTKSLSVKLPCILEVKIIIRF